jgi:hypothetical protein
MDPVQAKTSGSVRLDELLVEPEAAEGSWARFSATAFRRYAYSGEEIR